MEGAPPPWLPTKLICLCIFLAGVAMAKSQGRLKWTSFLLVWALCIINLHKITLEYAWKMQELDDRGSLQEYRKTTTSFMTSILVVEDNNDH
jgi:hypothetical protein